MAISSNATGLRPGVCTSTTRPTNPYTGQIVFETDTGYLRVWDGSAWDYLSQKQDNWYAPRGLLATTSGGVSGLSYYSTSSLSQGLSSAATITGSSMTVVLDGSRLYRLTSTITAQFNGAGRIVCFFRDGTTSIGRAMLQYYTTSEYVTQTNSIIYNIASTATKTFDVYATQETGSAGSIIAGSNYPFQFWIEDIGPKA